MTMTITLCCAGVRERYEERKGVQRDVQVEENDPRDDDRQAPFGALEFGTDMIDWARVVRVNVELDVLEIGRVVEHVEYQAEWEDGNR